MGLANLTDAYLLGRVAISCVERGNGTGDLGWAVRGPAASGISTGVWAQSTGTGKKNARGRMCLAVRVVIGGALVVVMGVWGCIL
jgi:hypothetical protein